jgi:hypothetical protein
MLYINIYIMKEKKNGSHTHIYKRITICILALYTSLIEDVIYYIIILLLLYIYLYHTILVPFPSIHGVERFIICNNNQQNVCQKMCLNIIISITAFIHNSGNIFADFIFKYMTRRGLSISNRI